MPGLSKIQSSRLDSSPSTAVVEAIADYFETDPMDLDRPLYEVIDPDALDALVARGETGAGATDVLVQFAYDDCLVQVSSDGAVDVSRAAA